MTQATTTIKRDYPKLKLTRYPVIGDDPADGRRKLIGSLCTQCGLGRFPSADVCSGCGGEAIVPLPLSEQGTLYSYSVLHVGARGWPAPYVLGYVDLPEGVRVFSHIDADPAALSIEMPVRMDPREPIVNPGGNEVLAYVFVPVTGENGKLARA